MIIGGCSQSDRQELFDEVNVYQGVWRDTLHHDGMMYIEDLVLSKNTFERTLSNMTTRIVYSKESGILTLGNENKMRLSGISALTNMSHQSYWNVIQLSHYRMRLYSDILGERNYRRTYYTSLIEQSMRDTLREVFLFKDYLPLSKNTLKTVFGEQNSLPNNKNITYLLNHPLFDKISFKELFENDTIFSYTLNVPSDSWNVYRQIIGSKFHRIRNVGEKEEFSDAEELENSTFVITLDSKNCQISLTFLKGYDYWPNVSRFLKMNIAEVKAELGKKYVYTCHEYPETGFFEYQFQASKDSLCSTIGIITDSVGTIHSCSVSLLAQYMKAKKKNAVKEEEKMALLLKKKYVFNREETDEDSNKVYYFSSSNSSTGVKMDIKLRLKCYQNGISNLYCVTIDYKNS